VTERMIERDGVRLCTDSFGDPADPPVILVMGMSASMLWWDEEFCRMLVAGGRLVVRYDHRDTGRSQTDAPGRLTLKATKSNTKVGLPSPRSVAHVRGRKPPR